MMALLTVCVTIVSAAVECQIPNSAILKGVYNPFLYNVWLGRLHDFYAKTNLILDESDTNKKTGRSRAT